ncbi:translation initiation factor IF-3 [Patescibacteria group bacterium]|nr:translation initiation factor IF-3 [Patescibacteria group bacterium]MBU1682877.1 translation initiation factor IF-3 [Patescibacteria group bacterium]
MNFFHITKRLRTNQGIRVPKVLLVDGDSAEEVTTEEALSRAREKGLDLVEVSPLSSPPVCKIIDYGTYLYSQKKKEQKQKRATKQTETKTIRLSIRTESHDLDVKAKKARKFLEDRNTVKVVVIFRGREMAHGDLAESKMNEFFKLLEDIANIEQQPKRQGYQMTMILNPLK